MQNGKDGQRCSVYGCGKKAETHHVIPRSDGGGDDLYNIQPLCFYHHKSLHSSMRDWSRWGYRGGKKTASDPLNFMVKFPQFQGMSQEEFNRWLLYYRGIGERPESKSQQRSDAECTELMEAVGALPETEKVGE